MTASVALVVKNLTNRQLAALNLTANFSGYDPHDLPFYSEVEELFTLDGGTRMATATLDALANVVDIRLGEAE